RPGQSGSHAAAWSHRPPVRRDRRRAGARRRTAGPHLQSGARHPSLDSRRARAGARTVRTPADVTTGILLMAHGTPSSMDDMPEYLRLVRGGRPPSESLVAEMRHNYEAIGGRSPLTDLTLAQAAALRERLGPEIPVAVGMRNWTPFIRDALQELAAADVTRVI